MHKACKTSQHLSNMVRYRYDKEIYRTMHFSEKRQWQNSAFQKFGNLLYEKTSSEITRSKNRFEELWTTYKMTSDKPLEIGKDYLNRWNEQYSNFLGITDVKKAQEIVTELTNKLQELQSSRKVLQREVDSIREQLLANHQNSNRTKMYSVEHSAIFKEGVEIDNRLNEVRKDFDQCERDEKETFGKLYSAIRDCHERQQVTELTYKLQELQSSRKVLQREVDSIRDQLLANNQNSNRTKMYSGEHSAIYKEGREINNRHNEVRKDFDHCEIEEKETFGKLSSAIRDCHELQQVTELTNKLQELQSSRKDLQLEVDSIREQLLANHHNYNRTKTYSVEHSAIFKEGVEINNRLNEVRKDFDQCERDDKETFGKLSIAIRACHERQQSQAEQSKSRGFIVSLVSCCITCIATLGFPTLVSSLNNWLRIKEIKEDVTQSNQIIINQIESQTEAINEMKEESIKLGKQLIHEIALANSDSQNSQQETPDRDRSSEEHVILSNKIIIDQIESQPEAINEMKEESITLGKQLINEIALANSDSQNSQQELPDRDRSSEEHVTLSNKIIIDQIESQPEAINEMKEESITLGKQLINEIVLANSDSPNSQQESPDRDRSSENRFPTISKTLAVGVVIGALIPGAIYGFLGRH